MAGEVAAAALPYASPHDSSLSYFDCSHLWGRVCHMHGSGLHRVKHHVRLTTTCVREDVEVVEVGPVKIGVGSAESHDRVNRIVEVG